MVDLEKPNLSINWLGIEMICSTFYQKKWYGVTKNGNMLTMLTMLCKKNSKLWNSLNVSPTMKNEIVSDVDIPHLVVFEDMLGKTDEDLYHTKHVSTVQVESNH